MVCLDGEAVVGLGCLRQLLEDRVGDVCDRSAVGAHQVGVVVLAKMVEGRPDSRVDVFDDLQLAQALEHSIDGRLRDTGRAPVEFFEEVVG